MANDKVIALTATSERPASTISGYAMLVVLLFAILADAYGINRLRTTRERWRLGDHRCRHDRLYPGRAGLLHASAEPGGGHHFVRRISAARTGAPAFAGPGRGWARRSCPSAPTTSFPRRSR